MSTLQRVEHHVYNFEGTRSPVLPPQKCTWAAGVEVAVFPTVRRPSLSTRVSGGGRRAPSGVQ